MTTVKPRVVVAVDNPTLTPESPTVQLDPFESLGIVPLVDLMEYLKVLIVGYTGAGKTRLAASAAQIEEMRPVLLIDCEAGTLSIEDRQGIDRVRITNVEELTALVRVLRDTKANPRYKTLIIDDGVEFFRVLQTQLLKEADPDHDPEILNRADYMRLQERTRILLRFFRDYPAHLIMTAKAREREDDTGIVIKPAFTGALVDELPGYFDTVGFLQAVRESEEAGITRRFIVMPMRRIQWVKDRTDTTGTRSHIENPTMSEILKNFIARRRKDG